MEAEHFPDGERIELEEQYRAKGYRPQDAVALASIHTSDQKLWLDEMMVQELGLLPDERTPILSAMATRASFMVAGPCRFSSTPR